MSDTNETPIATLRHMSELDPKWRLQTLDIMALQEAGEVFLVGLFEDTLSQIFDRSLCH